MKKYLPLLLSVVLLSACGDSTANTDKESVNNEPSTIVSSANVNPWPLAVDSAKIECFYSPKVVFSVGEKLYGLTGAASRNPLPEYEQMSIDTEIWLDNPDIPGTKISVSKLIEKGRELCE